MEPEQDKTFFFILGASIVFLVVFVYLLGHFGDVAIEFLGTSGGGALY